MIMDGEARYFLSALAKTVGGEKELRTTLRTMRTRAATIANQERLKCWEAKLAARLCAECPEGAASPYRRMIEPVRGPAIPAQPTKASIMECVYPWPKEFKKATDAPETREATVTQLPARKKEPK